VVHHVLYTRVITTLQTALTVALINKRYYNYTAIVYYENIALLLIMKGAIYVKGFGL